jgi:two-component system, LytTR family, response regulator
MEQKLSALIVDDKASARKLLEKLLEETQYFSEIKGASSGDEALDKLTLCDPDLIFVEINMPVMDGFTFLDQIPLRKPKPAIVFVTELDNFAIKALRKEVFDYLLKPVDRTELKHCIIRYAERRREQIESEKLSESTSHKELIPRIRVNTRTGTIFINPASILYCKADGNYTTICTGTKQLLCSMNLGKVEQLLPGVGFIRIGRSHIINFEYITTIDRKECQVTLVRENETAIVKLPKHLLKDLDIL